MTRFVQIEVRGRVLGALFAVATLTASACSTLTAQEPAKGHAALSCKACHSTHSPKGKHLWSTEPPRLTASGTALIAEEALCYGCHKEGSSGHFFEPGRSHPINVAPGATTRVPPELGTTFIEGLGQVITCTSCHTPHGSAPMLLKITDRDDRLCLACHRFE